MKPYQLEVMAYPVCNAAGVIEVRSVCNLWMPASSIVTTNSEGQIMKGKSSMPTRRDTRDFVYTVYIGLHAYLGT